MDSRRCAKATVNPSRSSLTNSIPRSSGPRCARALTARLIGSINSARGFVVAMPKIPHIGVVSTITAQQGEERLQNKRKRTEQTEIHRKDRNGCVVFPYFSFRLFRNLSSHSCGSFKGQGVTFKLKDLRIEIGRTSALQSQTVKETSCRGSF